jgi:hypothetical protein
MTSIEAHRLRLAIAAGRRDQSFPPADTAPEKRARAIVARAFASAEAEDLQPEAAADRILIALAMSGLVVRKG